MNDMEIATDLTKKMLKRKAEQNALILVQYYLESEIQDRENFIMNCIKVGVLAEEQMPIQILKTNFLSGLLLMSYTEGYNSSQANALNELGIFQYYFECSFFIRL
jgi:hypothetical protein